MYVVMGSGIVVAFLALVVEILWTRRAKLRLINVTRRFVTTAHSTRIVNVTRADPSPFTKQAIK